MANEGYAVRFKKSAAKELRSLDINLQLDIGEAIDDYRVVYEIDDSERGVPIVRVKHRRDAYRS